jgi:hypothetical protein
VGSPLRAAAILDRHRALLHNWSDDIAGRRSEPMCLTSTVPNIPAFPRVAALDSVDDVGTDPYYKLDLDHRDRDPEDYVGVWADRVREVAEEHGKTSHVWVQAFHVAEGQEHRIARCIAVVRSRGVVRVGVSGFRACEALDIRPGRPDVAWRAVCDAIGSPGAR